MLKQKKNIPPKKRTKKDISEKSIENNKSMVRITSGIGNLDKLIEGGIEKNSTNLLVGGSGSGKSIFGMQFLVEGLEKGEKCLYVTFEEKKGKFFRHMKRFGWDLEAYEKKGLFTFLEYTPVKVKTMLEEGGGTVESIIRKQKTSRMVIDSITSFALLFDKELAKREAALGLFNLIEKWEVTSILTLEGKPLTGTELNSRTLEFESDSIISLYFLRHKHLRKRFIEVLKMRGTNHSKEIYRFIIGNKGVTVANKPTENPLNK
ncbi:hypothetical protein CXT76_01250 [Candidatus Parvarchaeota archaeon]|jgi:circadian clock protein KaiC|nr:MAG: hypothetical protein CXT76_01250 [Candidatus Parvarchaeota archaeon]HIG52009.1 hypothetical protein [Candidatus Pacearchaeota archaeon]